MTGLSARRGSAPFVGKQSPAASESMDGGEQQDAMGCLSQNTGVKVRKAVLLSNDASRLLWLGYGDGRRLVEWTQSDGFEPFEETARLPLDANPYDMCLLSPDRCLVSFVNGDIALVNTKNHDFCSVKTYKAVHGSRAADSRKIVASDRAIYSGSSHGSLAFVDLETGTVDHFSTGFAGVRCLTTLAGNSLLASGHASGQLLIWDLRNFAAKKPSCVVTPSKKKLDGVTALDKHPAQANVIAFGTSTGAVGFSDIRGGSGSMPIPMTYDISSAAITDVCFHPQNGDHLLSSSADGTIVHWDATRVNSFAFSATSKESPWLAEKLGDHVKLTVIKNASFSAVNSLDLSGDVLLVANDMMSILAYPALRFSLTGSSMP